MAFYGSCIDFILSILQWSYDYASQNFETEVLNKKKMVRNVQLEHPHPDHKKIYTRMGGAFMDAAHVYHNVTRLRKTAI